MFCLGRSWWDPAPIFKGMFDDIKIYNYSITETPTKVESQENAEIPTTFALKQNYPNPFNPTTQIRFEMPSSQLVKLSVFNVLGQKVKTLVNKQLSAGKYSFEWDGTNESGNLVSSGVYFYRFETPAFTQVHKMMYIR